MESDCRCRGLSRFFFIGLLVFDLNAVGTAQRLHFLCQLLLPRRWHCYTAHFDDLKRARRNLRVWRGFQRYLVTDSYFVSIPKEDDTSKDCTEFVKLDDLLLYK